MKNKLGKIGITTSLNKKIEQSGKTTRKTKFKDKKKFVKKESGMNYFETENGFSAEQSISIKVILQFLKEHPLMLSSLVLSGSSLVLSSLILILSFL